MSKNSTSFAEYVGASTVRIERLLSCLSVLLEQLEMQEQTQASSEAKGAWLLYRLPDYTAALSFVLEELQGVVMDVQERSFGFPSKYMKEGRTE